MKKKIDGKVIADAITKSLEKIAESAATAVSAKADGNNGEQPKPDATNNNESVQKSVTVNIDQDKLTEAIVKALNSNNADDSDDNDGDGDGDGGNQPDDDKIKSVIEKAAKELGMNTNDLQILIKGNKKSKVNADESDDDDDDFVKKLIGGDNSDYESSEFQKKFNGMPEDEKDAIMDDWIADRVFGQ